MGNAHRVDPAEAAIGHRLHVGRRSLSDCAASLRCYGAIELEVVVRINLSFPGNRCPFSAGGKARVTGPSSLDGPVGVQGAIRVLMTLPQREFG